MERATISRQQQTQRAFLGAALMDPARAREYIIKLVPGMFDEGVSRAVFSAVQQLTMAGEPVDVITVINRASAGRPADEIRPGVVAMAETCPSVSNIGSYAAQILEDYRYSLLQGDLMKCMAKDAMDSDGVCRQLRRTLAVQDAIRSTQTDSTARDFDAVLDSALARLDEPDDSLKLGWPELDRYGVFGRQRVCVVAGRPACGKTDFSLNLAARLSKACRDELKYGCAFATLSADAAIGCKIRFHSPATAAALWSGEKGRIACGLAIIDTVPDEHLTGVWQPRVVNLYMDNAVTVLRRRPDGWNVQRLPHRMGRPLMEPLIWNATSGKPFGRSRLKRSIRTLIDDYIRTVANATIALEFDTTPQKYILGVTDEQYDVLISDKFKSYVGSLLAATSNPETGENPVFGQLAQGSLSPHTEKMRMTATQFAAATGLTVTDVGVVNDANPTSSDAILAQSQTLVLLAQQLNTGNGDALRTIAQMAQAILRNVPPGALTEEERNVMPHFKNPAMPSVAVTADAAIKIATAREEFASTDTFLEMIGFDQADIRRIRAQEQRVRGQQVLMEMEDEDNDAGVGDVHPQAGAAE